MKANKLLIMVAMQGEADQLLEKLSLKRDHDAAVSKELGANVFTDDNVTLLTFGEHKRFAVDTIGTQRASLLTWAAAKEFQPHTILNAGTAGGFTAQGAEIGDVYLCTNTVYHDRRINLPKFKEYGVGNFACHVPNALDALKLKRGILTTGNALDTSNTDMLHIIESGASAKDMEGAAIAEVSEHMGINYIGLKAVTDIVDTDEHTAEDQFLKNFSLATKKLSRVAFEAINALTT